MWPNCWVSVEFHHAPIPRKGSDSTTTTKFNYAAAKLSYVILSSILALMSDFRQWRKSYIRLLWDRITVKYV